MKAELVPDNGDPPIPITRDVTVVGRRGFCDVVIDHPSLSKRHCVLVKTDGLLVVRDLASTNGTKVKGQRIRWAALLPDDRLTLGGYKFRVYLGPDDVPGPSERAPQRAAKARQAAGVAAAGDDPTMMPGPAGFAPPSPVETPTFQPAEAWEAEEEDDGEWQKRLGEDLIIELD
jgi:predicted component of type VI protein secretion system